ncbi:hypothetical protein AVEN_201909-1 [Araneus ventricosus]|uniref:Uncharacterized protein n=1 Tax=Araneus ventricosus TaxID=182803 RepID=A0A4Y2WJV9_ARAVE|nr:hypothetical protein AVEN_201909-1 [Araneus ventricosus]
MTNDSLGATTGNSSKIAATSHLLTFVRPFSLLPKSISVNFDSNPISCVIQYLVNWRDVSDRREMDIFNILRTLCNTCVLHLQWMPSHVNLKYNDIADSLAKEGTTMPQAHVEP